jgi:hypothetical protein
MIMMTGEGRPVPDRVKSSVYAGFGAHAGTGWLSGYKTAVT